MGAVDKKAWIKDGQIHGCYVLASLADIVSRRVKHRVQGEAPVHHPFSAKMFIERRAGLQG